DSGSLDLSHSRLRPWIERFESDLRALDRFEGFDLSPRYRGLMTNFRRDWLERMHDLDFENFERDEQVDYVLLRLHLDRVLKDLARDEERFSEIAELVPFVEEVARLFASRQHAEPVDARDSADALNKLAKQVGETQSRFERARAPGSSRGDDRREQEEDHNSSFRPKPTVALRAADAVARLRNAMRSWYEFYNEYDPLFTWWVEQPYQATDQAFEGYGRALRERATGNAGGDRRPGATAAAEGTRGAGTGPRGGFGGPAVFGGRGGRGAGSE